MKLTLPPKRIIDSFPLIFIILLVAVSTINSNSFNIKSYTDISILNNSLVDSLLQSEQNIDYHHKNIVIIVGKSKRFYNEKHLFYFNDSVVIHETLMKYTFMFPKNDTTQSEYRFQKKRIIDLKAKKVFTVYPQHNSFSTLTFDEFKKNYDIQLELALRSNQEEFDKINKPYKKRSKRYRDKRIRKFGFWKDRFEWSVDTVIINQSDNHSLNLRRLSIIKNGVVKKEIKDTLIYKKGFVLADNFAPLMLLNQHYSHLLNNQNYLFWQSFMMNYNWDVIFLGEGVDSSTFDYVELKKDQFPFLLKNTIQINRRGRNPLMMVSDLIDFADEDILKDQVSKYYKNELSVIIDLKTIESLDSLIVIPDYYIESDFEYESILDFFQSVY